MIIGRTNADKERLGYNLDLKNSVYATFSEEELRDLSSNSDAIAQIHLGALLIDKGETEEAKEFMQKAFLATGYTRPLTMLVSNYRDNKQYAKAYYWRQISIRGGEHAGSEYPYNENLTAKEIADINLRVHNFWDKNKLD